MDPVADDGDLERLQQRCRALFRALDFYGRHKYPCEQQIEAKLREAGAAWAADPTGEALAPVFTCTCGLAHALNSPETWSPRGVPPR